MKDLVEKHAGDVSLTVGNNDNGSSEEISWMNNSERKRLLGKMDWHLLPLITTIYLLCFLDRANIGNARIAGMGTDVQLTGLKYNVIAAVFFVPYVLAEIPYNIALKLVRPSIWIPSTMVAWGVVMTLMSLCKTYEGLIIARLCLGFIEAGLFPGVVFYFSLWYRKREIVRRVAIFFSGATIAGAFGGILAYGIERMEGIGGLHGWQWIFCLEGIVTVLVAVASFFFMHDYPETARFLSEAEKQLVIMALKEDQQGMTTHFKFRYMWQALKDYKVYLQAGIYTGLLVPIYAIALFIPTIVHDLGFSAAHAQLLTIPPFVLGCISTLAIGIYSDKLNIRGPFLISSGSTSLIGFIILYTQSRPGVSYFGAILAAIGAYPMLPVGLAWAGSAAGGDIRRGVTIGVVAGIGNLGGICSSFIYFDAPRFFVGHGTCMGWLGLSIILSFVVMWDYDRLNKKKIAQCMREGIDESQQAEFVEMGNESPLFRYTL